MSSIKTNIIKIFLIIGLCILVSCKQKSTEVNQPGNPSFSSEASHCVSLSLGKTNSDLSDSIITYSFSNDLILDFSANGNCCPDSNRFVINHEIRSDTILITVIDTARNLCRCTCLYMIHTEISSLPMDRYFVRCRLGNGQSFLDPLHLIAVLRKNP